MDATKCFVREEVERAKYYPDHQVFLLGYELAVLHYEVVGPTLFSLTARSRIARGKPAPKGYPGGSPHQ